MSCPAQSQQLLLLSLWKSTTRSPWDYEGAFSVTAERDIPKQDVPIDLHRIDTSLSSSQCKDDGA
jgi:hypothetical protein